VRRRRRLTASRCAPRDASDDDDTIEDGDEAAVDADV
jgi:hypothetical protein